MRSTARRVQGVSVAIAGVMVAASVAWPAAGAVAPGAQGTDTALPATSSKVTVSGRDAFSKLKITVNQTKNLVNQAISITWTGGSPTKSGPGRFASNYLQIMQCWGDDDGTNKANPGPPPEQCEQGATNAVYGGRNQGIFPAGSFTTERIISRKDWTTFNPADGVVEAATGWLWKPFRAVDGNVTTVHYDQSFNPLTVGGNYWLNPYFNAITTNEIAAGKTGNNGVGSELFEVTTGVESSGLGCGQSVEPVPGGGKRVPKCWVVIVPRGTATQENVGSGQESEGEAAGVETSPLSPHSWKNRIAVPLEFNPVDSTCSLSADQRRIVGTELAVGAVSSWQPKLCSNKDLPPYAYGIAGDTAARQQLVGRAPGAPGMVVVSRPLDKSTVDPKNPLVYAPLGLSGIVIGFNVERVPQASLRPEWQDISGVRVATMNLTPRLVAKLLTQSYASQTAIAASTPPYGWVKGNPPNMGVDPDFLQFNPEFTQLITPQSRTFGGLQMVARNTDVARQVWEWILADPEAKAWLDGAPDQWGMNVDPVYATTAKANSGGVAFGDPVPDSFPKSDPYCYQAKNVANGPQNLTPPLLCGTDWLPYSQSLRETARKARVADDGAKILLDPFADSVDKLWKADPPQRIGSRAILSLTDTASASQYGLQQAHLSRAGDDKADRTFVAPDTSGLTAGVAAMAAHDDPNVLEPVPTASAKAAYPLTALSYAAIEPLALDTKLRSDYAAFVEYAAGSGQAPGLELGQLPPGYAPLPAKLQDQAKSAAKTIRELKATTLASAPAAGYGGGTAPAAAGGGQAEGASSAYGSSSGSSSASSSGRAPSAPTTAAGSATRTPMKRPSGPTTTAKRAITPATPVAESRMVMPGLVGFALLAALGALEITKRPRRLLLKAASTQTRDPAASGPGMPPGAPPG